MLLVRQRLSRTLSHAGPMLRFVTQCRWKYAVSFRRLLLSVESESSSPWMSMTVSGIAAAYLCATSRCQCCRSRCCSNSLKQYPYNFECIRLLLFYSVTFQSVIFQSCKFQSCKFSYPDLYLHAKFHGNRKHVFWTGGRTCTYGRTFETHFIRSTQKSRPKSKRY